MCRPAHPSSSTPDRYQAMMVRRGSPSSDTLRTARGASTSFRCEIDAAQKLLDHGRDGRLHRRIIGLGVAPADLDGPVICRMFNRAIARETPPKYLSSDNDPLFRLHRWCANLRILEVDEIKTIPCTPLSHPFVERLIGTVRREYLDRTFFWNRGDLERKLDNYQAYYNQHRCHTGLAGATPAERSGGPTQPSAKLESYTWRQHCHGLFQTPTPP